MQKKRKTQGNLKNFLVLLLLSTPLILGNSQCTERPKWTAKFYAGHSGVGGVVRCQQYSKEDKCLKWDIIKGTSERIDDGAWLSYVDIEKLEKEVLSKCERWKR